MGTACTRAFLVYYRILKTDRAIGRDSRGGIPPLLGGTIKRSLLSFYFCLLFFLYISSGLYLGGGRSRLIFRKRIYLLGCRGAVRSLVLTVYYTIADTNRGP